MQTIARRALQAKLKPRHHVLPDVQHVLTIEGTLAEIQSVLGTANYLVSNNPNERTMRNRRRSQQIPNTTVTRKTNKPYRPSPLRPKEAKNMSLL